MRHTMPSGIPATGEAFEISKQPSNKRVFPMLRSMGPLLDELCGESRPVLKVNHMRFEYPRLGATLGLYLPCDVAAVEDTEWWAENKFRTKGLMYLFPIREEYKTFDYGAERTVLMYEEILYGPIGRAVNWYLMLSYAYYKLDESPVPDLVFDKLCEVLLANFEAAQGAHHGHLLSEDSLRAGTGFDVADSVPQITMSATWGMLTPGKVVLE